MDALETFRGETRTWLEANCPPSMRTSMPEDETVWGGRNAKYKNADAKLWLDRMGSRGWTVPTWPKQYGGGGLSRAEARVLDEEMRKLGCRPPLLSFGIWMLGPVLLEFGSEEQKREHIPKIARGEIRWCQGYSEPGAGSDLAGLQTRCVDRGDHYLVNGQKIWTSYANFADWIFALVRTDPDAKKHEGISFLLIDMASPGVRTSPIRLISGSSPFCETFFENVKVPKQNLVGKINTGWTIAKRLLEHERAMISGIGSRQGSVERSLEGYAKKYAGEKDGRVADAALRERIARHKMDGRAFGLTLRRSAEEAKAGQGPGPAASMFKYYGTEQNKRKYEIFLSAMGTAALGWEGDGFSDDEVSLTREWLRSKANSIEGGTSEVQLNVIAKRVLGLPD
ncbi:MAG TPA: acyl-CoA dehydrogenase family protein [Candidatus Cybelea sp.]|nr:acyl-CoA dehydrogenase family protein [Candidatus Cybelea sp.]